MFSLLVIGALPWVLILFYFASRRSFMLLLAWLLIAPAVSHLHRPSIGEETLLFQTGGTWGSSGSDFYYADAAGITVEKLFKPTRIVIGLVIFVFLLNVCLKRSPWVPLDRTEKWMLLFSVILLVNITLWSARFAFGLHTGIDAFIVPFCSYFLARRFVSNKDRFQQLMRVLGYMGLYVIGLCVIERLSLPNLTSRLGGPFGSWDALQVVMAVVFFVTLLDPLCDGQMSESRRALPRSIRWFVMFMSPVVIFFTYTRGNWIGFLSGVFVFCLLGHRLIHVLGQLRAVGLMLIMMPIIVLFLPLFVPEQIIETRVLDVDNVLGRFATWIATLKLAREAPIFGVGLNNLHGLLRNETTYFGDVTNYSTPHNSFLSILVELGAVEFVTYMAVILTITRMGLNLYRRGAHLKDRWRGVGLVAIMFAYLVPSLFSNTLYIPGLIHLYVYVFAGAIAGLYDPLHSTLTRRVFSYRAYPKTAYNLPYPMHTWNRRTVERQYEQ